jgi:hypothetical protein
VSDTSNEETFTAIDGSVSYDLKLLRIRQEALGTGSTPASPATPPKSGKALAAAGAGVATATEATQNALPAMFAAPSSVGLVQK